MNRGAADVEFWDDQTLLTTGAGGVVHVWNVVDGSLQTAWDHGDVKIADCDVGDGVVALYIDRDFQVDTLFVYDAPNGKLIRQCPMSNAGNPFALALSSDGQFAAMGRTSPLAEVQVWDWLAGRKVAHLELTENPTELKFSADGQQLAVAERSGIVRVWHWRRAVVAETSETKLATESSSESLGQPSHIHWQAHARPARSVAFWPDRQRLISAGRDGRIVCWTWDRAAGHRIPHRKTIPQMAWVNSRNALALLDEHSLRLTDRKSGILIDEVDLSSDSYGWRLSSASENGCLAWSTSSGSVYCWETQTQSPPVDIPALNGLADQSQFVPHPHMVPQSELLITTQGNLTLKGWDTNSQRLKYERTIPPERRVIAISPTEPRLYFVSEYSLSWVDLKTGLVEGTFTFDGRDANCLAISPVGRLVAVGYFNRRIQLVNADSREVRQTLVGHLGTIMQLQFTSDGQTLLALDARGRLKLWQVSQGAELLTWPSRDSIQSFSLSPDGNGLALARQGDVELLEIIPALRVADTVKNDEFEVTNAK